MADNDDDFHDTVNAMADRLGLKGDRRRKYVHEHMTGAGYKMVPNYVPDDEDDDDDDDDSGFGLGKRRKSNRRRDDDDDERPRRRSKGNADNWYS